MCYGSCHDPSELLARAAFMHHVDPMGLIYMYSWTDGMMHHTVPTSYSPALRWCIMVIHIALRPHPWVKCSKDYVLQLPSTKTTIINWNYYTKDYLPSMYGLSATIASETKPGGGVWFVSI